VIIDSAMTAIICPPAPAAFWPSFKLVPLARAAIVELRAHLRSGVLVAVLVLAASIAALAEEALQEWVPEALEFPADMEVLSDRAIGSSIRMFSFSTARDGEELLDEWEVALKEAGFLINQSQDDILGLAIEFSGDDILNAKILVAPQSDGDVTVIEFDATLR